MVKKLISLAIAVILCFSCLAGCSNKKVEEKGGYVEEEYSLPEIAKYTSSSIDSLKELDNKDILMIVSDESKTFHKYISSDSGKTWNEENVFNLSIPIGNSLKVCCSKIDGKGNIYFIHILLYYN